MCLNHLFPRRTAFVRSHSSPTIPNSSSSDADSTNDLEWPCVTNKSSDGICTFYDQLGHDGVVLETCSTVPFRPKYYHANKRAGLDSLRTYLESEGG